MNRKKLTSSEKDRLTEEWVGTVELADEDLLSVRGGKCTCYCFTFSCCTKDGCCKCGCKDDPAIEVLEPIAIAAE